MTTYAEHAASSDRPNGADGRDYLLHMIKSLSALARRLHEDEMAILLEAILAAQKARESRRR